MIATVVGYKVCDFKDNKGQQVCGVSLKCLVDSIDTDFVGKDIAKIWLPMDLVKNVSNIPAVNSQVDLQYDFDGRKAVLVNYKQID